MNRALLDQGLAPLAARILRAQGWDAAHVSEINLAKAADLKILEIARRENRVCITLDHDFHADLAMTRAGQPSVILLRIQGLDAVAQAVLIQAVWDSCKEDLVQGAAISVDGLSIRIRRLPCGKLM